MRSKLVESVSRLDETIEYEQKGARFESYVQRGIRDYSPRIGMFEIEVAAPSYRDFREHPGMTEEIEDYLYNFFSSEDRRATREAEFDSLMKTFVGASLAMCSRWAEEDKAAALEILEKGMKR